MLCSSSDTAISIHSTVDEPSGSDSHGWVRHASRVCVLIARVLLEKIATANLVWLPSEDQKIIHAVGFHEIL